MLASFAYDPLTPLAFLRRSGAVFGDRLAVVDGERRFTYAELLDRSRRLAGVLRSREVAAGDRVAWLAPNSHHLLEAHHGVPMAGAVLVAMNTRLAAAEVAAILRDSGARLLVVDRALGSTAAAAIAQFDDPPEVLDDAELEALLDDAPSLDEPVEDETSLLSLNYTSGTTGRPKGVMYHHRGAFLQALAMVVHARLDASSVYLWTLPMFHCNGWTFPWAVTAAGGVHVCMRDVDPEHAWQLIRDEGVTHFCGAPTVLTMLANAVSSSPLAEDEHIRAFVGGAPPTPAMLEELDAIGIDVVHLYGLTESFGPAMLCQWRPEWDELPVAERAAITARQGVANVLHGGVRVVDMTSVDPATATDVAWDGTSTGEILLRGNAIMGGYFDDEQATAEATLDGWFRTGDIAVVHDDGYVEIRDRAKDVIISGGENISSIEVERVLVRHPSVLEAAVVGVPDERWGERPHAYVTLRDGEAVEADALRTHVREHLAGFKVPDMVVFGELPKTSTGKVQKNELRAQVGAEG